MFDREKLAKIFAVIWHGDIGEWRGFLTKADDFLSYPGLPAALLAPEAADAGAVAPIGWRWRHRGSNDLGWQWSTHEPTGPSLHCFEVQPLYASPTDAGMRERAAALVKGEVVNGIYRHWPAWGLGNRSEDDDVTGFADAMADAILALPLSVPSTERGTTTGGAS